MITSTSMERIGRMIPQSEAIYDEIDVIEHGEPRYRAMLRVGVNAVAIALKEGATLSDAGHYALTEMENPYGKAGPLDRLGNGYGDVKRMTLDRNLERETDARHSIHLTRMAIPYAQELYPHLDTGVIAALGINHDIVEVNVGDTPSLGMTKEERRAKERREAKSLRMLWEEYGDEYPQFIQMVDDYEHRRILEGRFVKGKDKLDAGYSHFDNDGYQLHHYYGYDEARFREAIDDGTLAMLPYCQDFPTIIEDRDTMTEKIVAVTYQKAAS